MPGWITGIFFFLADFITSLFLPHDSLHFNVVQMVVAVLLFTLLFTLVVIIIACWPMLRAWFLHRNSKK